MRVCLVLWIMLLAASLVSGQAAAKDQRVQVREDHFRVLGEIPQAIRKHGLAAVLAPAPKIITVAGERTAFATFRLLHLADAFPDGWQRGYIRHEIFLAARPEARPDLPWEVIRIRTPDGIKSVLDATEDLGMRSAAARVVIDPERPGLAPGLFVLRRLPIGNRGEDEVELCEEPPDDRRSRSAKERARIAKQCRIYSEGRFRLEFYRFRRTVNPDSGHRTYSFVLTQQVRSRDPEVDYGLKGINYWVAE